MERFNTEVFSLTNKRHYGYMRRIADNFSDKSYTINGKPAYLYDQLSEEAKAKVFQEHEADMWFMHRAECIATTAGKNVFNALCEEKGLSAEIDLFPEEMAWYGYEIRTHYTKESAEYKAVEDIADKARKVANEVESDESTQEAWEDNYQDIFRYLYDEDGEYIGTTDQADQA